MQSKYSRRNSPILPPTLCTPMLSRCDTHAQLAPPTVIGHVQCHPQRSIQDTTAVESFVCGVLPYTRQCRTCTLQSIAGQETMQVLAAEMLQMAVRCKGLCALAGRCSLLCRLHAHQHRSGAQRLSRAASASYTRFTRSAILHNHSTI
jgi:hypothetical protein